MFKYFKPMLIQFPNGKFGVMRRRFLEKPQFFGNEGSWWSIYKYVTKYCMYDTEELALERFLKIDASSVKILATLDDEWDLL